MKTNNMEINTQEYWTAKLDNILYRISMNTYELGVFCDGINTLRIAIQVNPINRNHTKWEANLLGYMNDQIIENVGTLFLVRGNSKTGVFHNIVEELKKANSKSLIRDGVNSILEDWVPRSIREQLKALDRAQSKLERETGHEPTKPETVHRYTPAKLGVHVRFNKVDKVWESQFTAPNTKLRDVVLALFKQNYKPIVHVPHAATVDTYRMWSNKARNILNSIRQEYPKFTFVLRGEN